MAKPILNRRILLSGNRRFGSLLFLLDELNRECLKVTCKSKIGEATLWREDLASGKKITLKVPKQFEISIDISYKYADSLLEIKQQQAGQPSDPKFVPVPLPVRTSLFSLKLKNWHDLPTTTKEAGDIVLIPPIETGEITIFFGFPSADGKLLIDEKYIGKAGRIFPVNLPTESSLNQLLIGITDEDLSAQKYDLTFHVPEHNT